jgi:hypothetical protein
MWLSWSNFKSIVMTLCDMEKIFLPSFFTVSVHLMVHLVEEVKLGGPTLWRGMQSTLIFTMIINNLVLTYICQLFYLDILLS